MYQVVSSSNVIAIKLENDNLHVVFHKEKKFDSKYIYGGVSEKVFNDFLASESKGSFVHKHLRGKYPTTGPIKLDEVEYLEILKKIKE